MKNLLENVDETLAASSNSFLVELEFNDGVLGGNPKHPDVFRMHIESRLRREAKAAQKRGDTPPSEERIQEIVARSMVEMFGENVEETIANEQEKNHTTFKHNGYGPYIETRQIKAMLREMMTTLGITMAKRGSKQTYQHLLAVQACDEEGQPFEGELMNQLNFERYDDIVEEVDDHVVMCAHVIGPQGPRSCIKHHDRICNAKVRFLIRAPADMHRTMGLVHQGHKATASSRLHVLSD